MLRDIDIAFINQPAWQDWQFSFVQHSSPTWFMRLSAITEWSRANAQEEKECRCPAGLVAYNTMIVTAACPGIGKIMIVQSMA